MITKILIECDFLFIVECDCQLSLMHFKDARGFISSHSLNVKNNFKTFLIYNREFISSTNKGKMVPTFDQKLL